MHSEHFFGSLKGRFQSLHELCFQIQEQKELDFVNMWVCCCLILHNLIVEIKESLAISSTVDEFYDQQFEQCQGPRGLENNSDDSDSGEGDQSYIGTEGKDFIMT